MADNMVSVIIPTYNRKDTLKRSIDSVLNQTYGNIEVIIVDDCSTDGSFEYIADVYEEVQNITYIMNDKNIGPGAARNVGVMHAKGEYVAFHDSDDVWMPDKLEKQMKLMKQTDDNVGFVYSSFCGEAQDGSIGVWPPENWENSKKEGDIFSWLLLQPMVGAITIVMKKEIFLTVGGFNEELRALEDYEFSLRVAQRYNILFIEEALARVYNSADSVGKSALNSMYAQCYIAKKYLKEYEKYGLKKEKYLRMLDEAKKYGIVGEFLKAILYNMQDEDYIQYVKETLEKGEN